MSMNTKRWQTTCEIVTICSPSPFFFMNHGVCVCVCVCVREAVVFAM